MNFMVSVAKSFCSGSEGTKCGRHPSEKKSKMPSSKTILSFENNMSDVVSEIRAGAKRHLFFWGGAGESSDFQG